MKSCKRSTAPLACGSPRSQKCQPTLSCPQNAAYSTVGRPPPACSPAWRSHTNVCGSPPSDHTQRRIPNNKSGICVEKISAPAPAREYPRQATTTHARRVWPCPTGTTRVGSHTSN
jgi:hypothetical protein